MNVVKGNLKSCCPTLDENEYHLRGWHPKEGYLTFEENDASCNICNGQHDIKRCPFVHPFNRSTEKPKKFIGPSCVWCHGKHLGIYCPKRAELSRVYEYEHDDY